jgi:hypothetical protein
MDDDDLDFWATKLEEEIDLFDEEETDEEPMPAGHPVDELGLALGWWEADEVSAAAARDDDARADDADAAVERRDPAAPGPVGPALDPAPGLARARPADDERRRVDAA